jgi:hypothetical protein
VNVRYAVAFVAVVLFTGCPYGGPHRDESQNAPSKTSTTATNPRVDNDQSTAMNPVVPPQRDMPGNRVPGIAQPETNVQLTEYSINMPDTLPAGPARLRIVNAGKENHNFVVEGNGISTKLPNDLTRGDTASLDLNLKAGTYTVWCPVDGHRGKGMQRTITVK